MLLPVPRRWDGRQRDWAPTCPEETAAAPLPRPRFLRLCFPDFAYSRDCIRPLGSCTKLLFPWGLETEGLRAERRRADGCKLEHWGNLLPPPSPARSPPRSLLPRTHPSEGKRWRSPYLRGTPELGWDS